MISFLPTTSNPSFAILAGLVAGEMRLVKQHRYARLHWAARRAGTFLSLCQNDDKIVASSPQSLSVLPRLPGEVKVISQTEAESPKAMIRRCYITCT